MCVRLVEAPVRDREQRSPESGTGQVGRQTDPVELGAQRRRQRPDRRVVRLRRGQQDREAGEEVEQRISS